MMDMSPEDAAAASGVDPVRMAAWLRGNGDQPLTDDSDVGRRVVAIAGREGVPVDWLVRAINLWPVGWREWERWPLTKEGNE